MGARGVIAICLTQLTSPLFCIPRESGVFLIVQARLTANDCLCIMATPNQIGAPDGRSYFVPGAATAWRIYTTILSPDPRQAFA